MVRKQEFIVVVFLHGLPSLFSPSLKKQGVIYVITHEGHFRDDLPATGYFHHPIYHGSVGSGGVLGE